MVNSITTIVELIIKRDLLLTEFANAWEEVKEFFLEPDKRAQLAEYMNWFSAEYAPQYNRLSLQVELDTYSRLTPGQLQKSSRSLLDVKIDYYFRSLKTQISNIELDQVMRRHITRYIHLLPDIDQQENRLHVNNTEYSPKDLYFICDFDGLAFFYNAIVTGGGVTWSRAMQQFQQQSISDAQILRREIKILEIRLQTIGYANWLVQNVDELKYKIVQEKASLVSLEEKLS